MKPSVILLTSLLAAGLPACAAEAQAVLSGGFVSNQGNTLDLTHRNTGGYNFEGGVLLTFPGLSPQVLAYAGLVRIPGKKDAADQPVFKADGPHFGFDLVFHPWAAHPALSLRMGPSFHLWQMEQVAGPTLEGPGDQHLKLGWRGGLGYDFDRTWGVSLQYTLTEWRSDTSRPYVQGVNPSRPAYVTLMGSYRF